jgi:ParB-like chromosome segregation protein Spo0J
VGRTNPILIAEDGTIIAGHARVLAARKLGLQEVPVVVARGWSEAQIRAYVIADNKLAEKNKESLAVFQQKGCPPKRARVITPATAVLCLRVLQAFH